MDCLMAMIRHFTASRLLVERVLVSISKQLLGKALNCVQILYLYGSLG